MLATALVLVVPLIPAAPPQERDPGPVLTGRVTDGEGRSVPGVRIVAYGGLATRWRVAEASTASDGTYRFDPCNFGARVRDEEEQRWDYHVGLQLEHPELVSADGGWWWDVSVPDVDGAEVRQDFELIQGGALRGRVLDELGKPHALSLRLNGVGDSAYFRWIETDAQGRIDERALFPGTYEVDVNDPKLDYPVIGRVEVRAGEATECQLEFERRREGEAPRRVQSRFLIVDGQGVGSVSLMLRTGRLRLDARLDGEPRQEDLDLRSVVEASFRPLCFETTGKTTLALAGVLAREPFETVLGELDWSRAAGDPERWRELYRGTGIVRPVALDVLPSGDLVILDAEEPALVVWERTRRTLHTLATLETAPGLEHARFLSVEAVGSGHGYVLRTCSVDAQGENIPLVTKPRFLYLTDEDGDFVVDDVWP